MPRPPILEVLNWEEVYNSGLSFSDWLAIAESEEKRENMRSKSEEVVPPAKVLERLEKLNNPAYVVAIAEDWCGDVVRHVPALEALNSRSDKVNVCYVSREQHRDVFVRFLTNGGEAIPKFVFLNKDFCGERELGADAERLPSFNCDWQGEWGCEICPGKNFGDL